MLILPVRAIILYFLVVLIIRLMGKHQIGQLQPYELVITIMISELASVPMQDTEIPLINGIIPMFTLLFIQVILSLISMKSPLIRQWISGKPSILVANGQIDQTELSRLRYNLTDLLEQLRLKGFPNIADVNYAILETSGKLSVIPKSQNRPVEPEDLKLTTVEEGLPALLIEDGLLKTANLAKNNISEVWLLDQLQRLGFTAFDQIFLASCDASGKLFVQPKSFPKERLS